MTTEDDELLDKFEARVRMHHDAEAENDRLREALRRIAFLRPAGATPKLVNGALIEQIEKIALDAISKAEPPPSRR